MSTDMNTVVGIDYFLPVDERTDEEHIRRYPLVFTEVIEGGGGLPSYTAIIGEVGSTSDDNSIIRTVEDQLYVVSLTPIAASSRAYEGVTGFHNENEVYFTLLFPAEHLLRLIEPALRWRFRIAFEYPRRKNRGFIVPTMSTLPFGYCLISEREREEIEHLCPPEPVARYLPEEFGYSEDELRELLKSDEQKGEHVKRLHSIMGSIFNRTNAKPKQYVPMSRELLPAKYREYEILYNANVLGDW